MSRSESRSGIYEAKLRNRIGLILLNSRLIIDKVIRIKGVCGRAKGNLLYFLEDILDFYFQENLRMPVFG